jgi:hypothetical protein
MLVVRMLKFAQETDSFGEEVIFLMSQGPHLCLHEGRACLKAKPSQGTQNQELHRSNLNDFIRAPGPSCASRIFF